MSANNDMETEVRADLTNEEESLSPSSLENMDENSTVVEDVETSETDSSLLGPITPDLNREVRDFLIDSNSPPPLISLSPPMTPTQGVFDPFAPGPEKHLNAPYSRKYRSMSQVNAIRRLDFDHFEDDAEAAITLDDEILLETLYATLLEAIVSWQSEGYLGLDSEDGCRTPESPKRLTGIAETCPEAPMKCAREPRNFDQSLCRKLEF